MAAGLVKESIEGAQLALAEGEAEAEAEAEGDAVTEGDGVADGVMLGDGVADGVTLGVGLGATVPLIETSSIAQPPKLTVVSLSKWKVTVTIWPAKSEITPEYLPQPADSAVLPKLAPEPTVSLMV